MDVNAALAALRAAKADYWRADTYEDATEAANRAMEAYEGLDEWLSKGGSLPEEWNAGRPPFERNSDGSWSFSATEV